MMRGVSGLTIVDPCDALDIEQAVPQIAAHKGPVYVRLLPGQVPLVLDEVEGYRFELGTAKLPREGAEGLVISSGILTMRALEVAENHSVVGGLGEAVASTLLRHRVQPARFELAGLPDAFLDAGALPTLHDGYGIQPRRPWSPCQGLAGLS